MRAYRPFSPAAAPLSLPITRASISSKGSHINDLSLSSRIKSCTSFLELVSFFDSHAANDELNHIHMSSLLSGIAKTAPRASRMRAQHKDTRGQQGHNLEVHASFNRMMKHAVKPSIVSQMGPRELATSIWSAAKVLGESSPPFASPLSLPSPTSWLEPLLGRMLLVIPRFNPQDISMCLWSLATLTQASITGEREGNTSKVIDALIRASCDKMDVFGAQSISNTLWALSKLGKKPSGAWMRTAESRLVAVMHDLTPQALANTSWSFVLLEHSPSSSWQSSFLKNTRMTLFDPSFSPSSSLVGPSAVIVWSISRLGMNVDNAWFDALAASVYSCLSSIHTITNNPNLTLDLTNILWSFATQGYRPRPQIISSILSQCILPINSLGANEICSLIWSIAKMRYVPSGSEWKGLSEAVSFRCPSCSAQGLCNVVWSVATLRISPGKEWMREILSTLRLKMEDCGPQELANLWWALGMMQWPLDEDLKEDLSEELSTRIDDFNAAETTMILWALVRLKLKPTSQALIRHLEIISGSNSSSKRMEMEVKEEEELTPRTLSTLFWCLSQLNKSDHFISSSTTPLGYPTVICHQRMGGRRMWGLQIRALIHRILDLASTREGSQTASHASQLPSTGQAMKPRDTAISLYSLSLLKIVPPMGWLIKAAEALASASPDISQQLTILSGNGSDRQSVMTLRDASMAAHGLSSALRLHDLRQKALIKRKKRALAGVLMLGGSGSLEKNGLAIRMRPKAVEELIPLHLKKRCLERIILCGALGQSSSPPSRHKEVSVVTLLASLPPILTQQGHMTKTRITCLPQIESLVLSAQLSLQGARPSHLSISRREATSILSSMARLGLKGNVKFVADALEVFLSKPQDEGIRDWIICLWSLEKVLSHEEIFTRATSQAHKKRPREWLKVACEVILKELSRPIDDMTNGWRPAQEVRVASSEEWRASRPRRLASSDELQSASASALRLHQSILKLLEDGGEGQVDDGGELIELGLGLRKVSGRLRQVHWRRVYIGKASNLKRLGTPLKLAQGLQADQRLRLRI